MLTVQNSDRKIVSILGEIGSTGYFLRIRMMLMLTLIWSLCILKVCEGNAPGSVQNIYASACVGSVLKLSCPSQHRLAIKRVEYGVKDDWDCHDNPPGYHNGIQDVDPVSSNSDYSNNGYSNSGYSDSGYSQNGYTGGYGYSDSGQANPRYISNKEWVDAQRRQGSYGQGSSQSSNGYPLQQRTTIGSRKKDECCKPGPFDCQMDADELYSTLNVRCSGRDGCDIKVDKETKTKAPCDLKKPVIDYMTVVYSCVPDYQIANICSDDVKRGHEVFLMNSEYPNPIRARDYDRECQCLVLNSRAGISIMTIDLLLASTSGSRDRSCPRSLTITDSHSYKRHIKCAHRGFYGFKSIYSRAVTNVTLSLSVLEGEGMAFVWLQAKPNQPGGSIDVYCGQSRQDLLDRIRYEQEARNREQNPETVTPSEDTSSTTSNGTMPSPAGTHLFNPDLAAIVGGIVAAGLVLIGMVIVAMILHCSRTRKEKTLSQPITLYAADNSEPLDLSSYCRYDDGDDDATEHLCTLERARNKTTDIEDNGEKVATIHRPNGFVTVNTPDDYHHHRDPTPSPPLPAGLSTPPPSLQNQPLLSSNATYREVHYPGDLSLRFVKPIVKDAETNQPIEHDEYMKGHVTLPANRKAVLINNGPKSPLGKRSKSVTFSQPVAMVTPLNSESEESMEKSAPHCGVDGYGYGDEDEDPSYDNLHKLDIPDYPPAKPELIHIPQRWNKDPGEDSPTLSTFTPSPPTEVKVIIVPPPDLSYDNSPEHKADHNFSPNPFWSPTKHNGKPVVMPKPQQAKLYETGV